MKRWIHASLILFLLISIVLFDTTVFANSSWQWISKTRPFDLLPIVAVATIFIETAAINWGGNVHRLYKVFGMNILANMVSFLVPYLLNWADQVTHMKYPVFSDMIQYDHIYTVGTYYFILTLLAEGPIMYFSLKKDVGDTRKKRLLSAIIISNLITTILVAVIERSVCYGIW